MNVYAVRKGRGEEMRGRRCSPNNGLPWFKVGADSGTGDIVAVTLWGSQADIDAFLNPPCGKRWWRSPEP